MVNRRLRGALVAVGALLVLTALAGVLAVLSADRAAQERDSAARDRDLAAEAAHLADARRAGAQGVLHEDLATGLLLAVQSLTVDDSSQAWDNLGAVLARAGPLVGLHDVGAMLDRPGTAYMASIAASPDGALVAGTVLNTGVFLFDARTLSLLPFDGVGQGAASIAFSPDSRTLAVVADDRGQPIRLYDLPEGTLSQRQPGGFAAGSRVEYTPSSDVDVAFSADGTRFVAQTQKSRGTEWSTYGDVMVWDTADPSRPVLEVRLPRFAHPALSPDGERLYVATRGAPSIRTYDVASGGLVASVRDPIIATTEVSAVEISPDGATLAVAAGDHVLRFGTARLRRRGPTLGVPTGPVHEVTFSRSGRLLATASEDQTAIVWDGRTGDQLHRYVGGGPVGVAFSADDETLFTAGGAGLILAWEVPEAGRQLVLGEDTPADDGVEYSLSLPAPDGRTIARVRSGRLWFEDTRTGRTTGNPARVRDTEFEWSTDARWLLSHSGSGEAGVTVWDAETGSVVARSERLPGGGNVTARFSSDARVVFVHDQLSLHTLSRPTLQPVNPAVPLPAECNGLAPHPTDGSVFLIHCDGSFVRVDPRNGDVLDTGPPILSGEDAVDNVMSPDGTRMVGPAADLRVRLLDVNEKQFLGADTRTPYGSSATFAPDGSQFAVVQAERIRLFDGRSGDYQASVPLPTRLGTVQIVYRRDSSGLVIASTDGRTWTADTRLATWVDRACATAGRNLSLADWEQYFPNLPYERTCPQWPAGT
jgi:WD40 repeat protein